MRAIRVAALVVLGGVAAAQPEARPTAAQIEHAINAWLESDPPSEAARDAAAGTVLDAGLPALRRLGAHLTAASLDDQTAVKRRRQGLESLVVAVGLQFLDRAADSKMIFAGQYDPLRELQPYVGELYLSLLFETPDWFPNDRRVLLVPALRDLFVESPGEVEFVRMREMADDEQFEPVHLRARLSYALAQWGDAELVEGRKRELSAELETATGTDRLDLMRSFAELYYNLRQYRQAAARHREFLHAAHRERYALAPVDYYNAACCMCLSGDLESALAELERCVKLMRSDRVDRSLVLDRSLFENDPEIATVRKTKRFKALFAAAFPPDPVDGAGPHKSTIK